MSFPRPGLTSASLARRLASLRKERACPRG
jgi:hypothetical protein